MSDKTLITPRTFYESGGFETDVIPHHLLKQFLRGAKEDMP